MIVVGSKDCLARFSYLTIFEPKAVEEGGALKYSVTVLIPKGPKGAAEMAKLMTAVKAAEKEGLEEKSAWKGSKPTKYKYEPIRDGDLPNDAGDLIPEYADHWYINAKSDTKPVIVGTEKGEDGKFKEVTDPLKIISGDWGRVCVNAYPYSHKVGGKGISWGLNHVQKIKDGVPFGGAARLKAEAVFDDDFLSDDIAGETAAEEITQRNEVAANAANKSIDDFL